MAKLHGCRVLERCCKVAPPSQFHGCDGPHKAPQAMAIVVRLYPCDDGDQNNEALAKDMLGTLLYTAKTNITSVI